MLTVEEAELGAVEALVEFCYTGALPQAYPASVQDVLRMYRVADRLEVRVHGDRGAAQQGVV